MNLVEAYALGAVITSCWIVVWFLTSLPLHIWSILRLMPKDDIAEDDYNDLDLDMENEVPETWEDWETLLCTQNKFFSELLTCPLCLGHWIATIVAIIIIVLNGLTWWFLPAAVFSWPLLAFFIYKTAQKK
jgi:hypothetical protein